MKSEVKKKHAAGFERASDTRQVIHMGALLSRGHSLFCSLIKLSNTADRLILGGLPTYLPVQVGSQTLTCRQTDIASDSATQVYQLLGCIVLFPNQEAGCHYMLWRYTAKEQMIIRSCNDHRAHQGLLLLDSRLIVAKEAMSSGRCLDVLLQGTHNRTLALPAQQMAVRARDVYIFWCNKAV